MAETGAAEIIHPNHTKQAASTATLKTALLSDGFTAAELSQATKNDLVYMDAINATRRPVNDRQDAGAPNAVCTGATAGIPGVLTPPGCIRPANLAAMSGKTASPATAWTEGQYVNIYNDVDIHWDGNSWEDGPAPA